MIFLADKNGRTDVRNEFRCLMRKDFDGIPIGRLINYADVQFRLIPKIHTTTVCKIKPNHGNKIRLCLRGDLQEESKVQFASALTAGGDFPKLFLSMRSMRSGWIFCTVDLPIYLKVAIAELLPGRYEVEFLTKPSVLPMMNPFKPSPFHVQIQKEFQDADPSFPQTRIVSTNLSASWVEKSSFVLHSLCNDCRTSSSLFLPASTQSYIECFLGSSLSISDPARGLPFIHSMALSDCAHVISCLSRDNPRTQKKPCRVILNPLKGAMPSVNIFASTNFYRVGFMFRKECRQVIDSRRPEMARESDTSENLHINSRSSKK